MDDGHPVCIVFHFERQVNLVDGLTDGRKQRRTADDDGLINIYIVKK